MFGASRRFLILAVGLIVVNAAGLLWIRHDLQQANDRAVHVLSTSLEPQAAAADRIAMVFDRPVVAEDRIGQVEDEPLFTLQPAVAGKWVWAGRDRAEFQLDSPLPAGRIYHALSTSIFEARTGWALASDTDIVIKTAAPAVQGCAIRTSDESDLTVELSFNQPIADSDLLRNLRAFDDKSGDAVKVSQCLTYGVQRRHTVRIDRPASSNLRLVVSKDLKGHGGDVAMAADDVRTFRVPAEFAFLSAHAGGDDLDEMVEIRLDFNRTLDGEQKLSTPAITPPVEKVDVHRSGPSLVVTGPFKATYTYRLVIPGTLLAKDGKTLGQDVTASIVIPRRDPDIRIPHSVGVLTPGGNLMLDAKVVNVPTIRFEAYRVHENNLVAHLSGQSIDEVGRPLGEKTVKLDLAPNVPQKIAIDLKPVVGAQRGIYSVAAHAADSRWIGDNAVVIVTDLGLTAKRGPESLSVWATSLATGKPAAGVAVRALSRNNQLLVEGRTDERGLATLALAPNHPDGPPWVVVASTDNDASCLRLDENQWMLDDVAQDGRPYPETYEVMLYSDRGVYRPGDTVNLTGIVRDKAGRVPTAFPLVVKAVRPDGRTAAELAAKNDPDRQGFFHVTFTTAEDSQTGPYSFQATLPGDKKELGTAKVLVEAFVPVRMEVKAAMTAPRFRPDETPKVSVSGRYLWDQPAAGVPVTAEGTLTATTFQSKGRADFRFGPWNADAKRLPLAKASGLLDDHGKTDLDISLPKDLPGGLYRMAVATTVTEPGGRSVSANATATVDRFGVHVGLRLPSGSVAAAREPVSLDWVRLTGDDTPAAAGEMEMRLSRVEFDSVVRRVSGRFVWESVERAEKIETRDLAAGGDAGSLQVTCREAGMYRLTLADRKTGSTTDLDFYVYENGAGGGDSLAMNRPERLDVVVNQPQFRPGETAKVVVRSPVPGTMLLTLETDRVVWSHVAEVTGKAAEVEVPLPADLRGGAFLLASVVRPVDPTSTSWLPHRAMGMARIKIDHSGQRLPLAVTAPAKARPGETVTIAVETGSPDSAEHPAMVHLWAVDEGILLTAAYKTPDAEGFFLGARSLGMETSDLFFSLLPDYKRPEGMVRIGAGDDGGENFSAGKLRRNPVSAPRRAPAVIWRTAAPVDKDGRLTVEMKMPDLVGQMRLMAVAIDGDRYGRVEKPVTLTTPMIVEATWPRFAAPGDAFEVPVKIFNTTDKPVAVRVAVKTTGPVEVAADKALDRLEVKPGQPVTQFLKVKATGLGPVEATVELSPLDGGDADLAATCAATFPVRPAAALHSEVQLVEMQAGKTFVAPLPKTLVKGAVRATVEVGPQAAVHLAPALEELIHYPYGCVEQTSSLLYALLYAPRIMAPERSGAIKNMVDAGINRLWSMQTRSGGLSYWPGGGRPCMWGTTYAASCLLEAKAAGYDIDPRFTQELTKYLASEMTNGRQPQDDDASDHEVMDNNTRAFICHVLAVFGDPPHGWMGRLAEQADTLDTAGRAHLAAAFFAAGRKDRAAALLPKALPPRGTVTTSDGRLTSPTREDAVLLSVLLDVDPKNILVTPLAARLEKARTKGAWGSTLSNASALAALAKYQAAMGEQKPDFSGTVRCGTAAPLAFDHTRSVSRIFEDAAGPIEISSSGTSPIYGSITFEGLAERGTVEPYSRGLTINRRWVGADGKTVSPESLHVGDLVRVIVAIQSPGDVRNVAIVDALPGGMEVENPMLATAMGEDVAARPQPPAADNDSEESDAGVPVPAAQPRRQQTFDKPDHVEFLDDRVILFTRTGRTTRVFSYSLRVIAAGEFVVPPIQASCMYDPAAACLGKEGRMKSVK